MQEDLLKKHLQDRPVQLKEAKKNGVKVIGYFPGNFVPEELIVASGAIPVCLVSGGSPQPAEAALSIVPQIICPFARAQLGERLLNTNPYYTLIDMLVAPVSCQHLKKVTEVMEYSGDLEIFKLGIPHQSTSDFEQDYYTDRLKKLKNILQDFTGNEITDERLGQAVALYNRMRGLLRKISLMRRDFLPPLDALGFIKLNHASFLADPVFMVDWLDSVSRELKNKQQDRKTGVPRILLIGPNIGIGDYDVLELVKAAGGEIVIEEVCEGVRSYWKDIENSSDLFQSLTRGYLIDRLPCAFLRDSARKRLDFTLELIHDYNVSGVIWYELLCCETYDAESYYFSSRLAERNIPMLILESNYTNAETGQLKTRIEAFIEILKGAM
jgi:benzoyl-CoA reductase/2-hydroxyglutaryl-CoA dehydratase subunit BcrC/BadD/HgdB